MGRYVHAGLSGTTERLSHYEPLFGLSLKKIGSWGKELGGDGFGTLEQHGELAPVAARYEAKLGDFGMALVSVFAVYLAIRLLRDK